MPANPGATWLSDASEVPPSDGGKALSRQRPPANRERRADRLQRDQVGELPPPPVQLHDRSKRLLREVEDSDDRLRKPNLTDLVIALLQDGPRTPAEVAAAIRAKRAAENDGG